MQNTTPTTPEPSIDPLKHLRYLLSQHRDMGASLDGLYGGNQFARGYVLAIDHVTELVDVMIKASEQGEEATEEVVNKCYLDEGRGDPDLQRRADVAAREKQRLEDGYYDREEERE